MRRRAGRASPGAPRLPLLTLVLPALLAVAPAVAADKNGVAPNVISLPAGPGSIEGLGESFQPQLNTGTARYAVRIPLPKGHNTPELKLQYESGFGDGPAGIGWVFGPGSIARQVDKGIPRYVDAPNGADDDHDGEIDEADETDTYVGPDGEELVPVGGGVYRARIEGGFVRYRKLVAGWEATVRNGTRLEFGTTAAGRVADAAGEKLFRWLLERSTDTNGNVIEYRWGSFPGSDSQKYLREIRYGPGAPPWAAFYFASFAYTDKPDWRADYRSGFLVRTTKRLAKIEVGIQGTLPAQCAVGDWNADGVQDALISRFAIGYDPAHPDRSFLAKITRFGADGVNWLPPISFGYSVVVPPAFVSAAGFSTGTDNPPLSVMDSELVELVDLNRDGLPDILQTDRYGGFHKAYLNLGADSLSGGRVRWDAGRQMASADGLAPLLPLAEKRVHLADMDGDGLADLAHTTAAGEVFWFPNSGSAGWQERRRMNLADTTPPAPFTSADATVADLDFDKRTDVVLSTESGYAVWFNRGEGRYSREVRTPGARHGGAVLRFSDGAVRTADMNGDRLVDVVRITPTSLLVAAGMGHGTFAPTVEVPIPGETLTDGPDGQISRARLEDVNGDGLADLAIERAAVGELHCWLNRGTDALGPRIVVTGMPVLYGENTAVRWADLNGNGTTDLVYADSTADERLRMVDLGRLFGGSPHPNLLVRIENGLGVTTAITWRPSTVFAVAAAGAGRPWTSTVPFPVQVVAAVETATGMDLDDLPGPDLLRKEFSYRDGFYEDRERAFRGFGEVRVTEPGDASAPTRVGVSGFFTGGPDGADNDGDGQIDEILPGNHREEEALKGMVRFTETRSAAGVVYLREQSDWRVRTLLAGTEGSEVRFAYRTGSDALHYEGTATPETVRTTWVYDDFGNPTEERRSGALSIDGDEVFTFTGYINDATHWIVGLPRSRRVTAAAGTVVEETLTYYDGPDYAGLPFGQAEKGNLTRTLGRVREGEYVALTRTARDAWGNVVGSLDPNGSLRTVDWDPLLRTFPVREQIQVGGGKPDLVVTAEWNLGLGTVTSSTDFNGHRSTYRSDTFGRLAALVLPGDSEAFPTLEYSYTITDPSADLTYRYDQAGALTVEFGPAGPSVVATRARETSGQPGTFDGFAYVDGLGRRLGAAIEGESGFIWKEAALFNAHGAGRWHFLPFQSPLSEYARPPVDNPATEIHYDAVGRETERLNPRDALGVLSKSTTTHRPLRRVVTDENLVPKEYVYDGLGRLREVVEHNGAETYVTRHTHDAAGRLVRSTDVHGNVKSIAYDTLGRRTAVDDPDGGRREYAYDAAGNLTRTTDNKRQTVLFTYDGAHRQRGEYHLGGSGLSTAAERHYDTPAPDFPSATNLQGRLAWSTDRSGKELFSYDARGNVAETVRRIGFGADARTYRTTREHDSLGRLVSRTFPDGDRISYGYNSRALLESIPGIVADIDYHPSGAVASIAYGSGVLTDYSFDPRGRLIGLRTTPPAAGTPLQDLGYTFDGVGNVIAIDDLRVPVPADASNATRHFVYDDLNRLTGASGPGYGRVDFGYDPIGNIVSAASPDAPDPAHIDDALVNLGAISHGGAAGAHGRGLRLPGDPPGPHAVTGTTSGLSFGYDDNGNLIANDADSYDWDFRDRLSRAVTAGGEAHYLYDGSGRRVVKSILAGGVERTTHYVDAAYEMREGRPIKHIFAGSRRVASVEGRLSDGGDTLTLAFEPGWNFFALALEPSDATVAAVLAPLSGAWTSVWTWDAAAREYLGTSPAQGIFDLAELHANRGYLIWVAQRCSLEITGVPPAGDALLAADWNLAASPVENTMSVEEAFAGVLAQVEALWGWDPLAGTWSAWFPLQVPGLSRLASVEPGRAYWIKLSGAATIQRRPRPTSISYYHPDHLGSSSLVTDAAGTPQERTEFHPYGRIRHEEGAGPALDYRFTGKERDRETGLDYFGARYYLPTTGNFVSPDPLEGTLEAPQSLNRYTYAWNNPLAFVDPDGRDGKRTPVGDIVPEDEVNVLLDVGEWGLKSVAGGRPVPPEFMVKWVGEELGEQIDSPALDAAWNVVDKGSGIEGAIDLAVWGKRMMDVGTKLGSRGTVALGAAGTVLAVAGSFYTGYQVGYDVAESWDANYRKEQQEDASREAAYLDAVENERAEQEYRKTHPMAYRLRHAQAEQKRAGGTPTTSPFVAVDPDVEGSFIVNPHEVEHIELETGMSIP